MNEQTKDEVRAAVRDQYGKVARTDGATGCAPSCCAPGANSSLKLGYSSEDLATVPEGANMGLGCGNPQAIADACCHIALDARGRVLSCEPRPDGALPDCRCR